MDGIVNRLAWAGWPAVVMQFLNHAHDELRKRGDKDREIMHVIRFS